MKKDRNVFGVYLLFCNIIILGLLTGCLKKDEVQKDADTPTPTPTADTPVVVIADPVAVGCTDSICVTVSTRWEGSSDTADNIEHKKCLLSGIVATPGISTCIVNIPEADLVYGSLMFEVVAGTDCKYAFFTPYSYKMSTTDIAFVTLSGETDVSTLVNCTDSPTPKECYYGAGTELLSDITKFKGLYFMPTIASRSHTYTVKSANEQTNANAPFNRNRWTVNDKTNPALAYDGPGSGENSTDSYAANTMQNWTIECTDEYKEPLATMTIKITDDDGATDHEGTWP